MNITPKTKKAMHRIILNIFNLPCFFGGIGLFGFSTGQKINVDTKMYIIEIIKKKVFVRVILS